MKRHLDIDITMKPDGSYTIEVSENETGERVGWDYKPGSMYHSAILEDTVTDEIRGWLELMDEERSER